MYDIPLALERGHREIVVRSRVESREPCRSYADEVWASVLEVLVSSPMGQNRNSEKRRERCRKEKRLGTFGNNEGCCKRVVEEIAVLVKRRVSIDPDAFISIVGRIVGGRSQRVLQGDLRNQLSQAAQVHEVVSTYRSSREFSLGQEAGLNALAKRTSPQEVVESRVRKVGESVSARGQVAVEMFEVVQESLRRNQSNEFAEEAVGFVVSDAVV